VSPPRPAAFRRAVFDAWNGLFGGRLFGGRRNGDASESTPAVRSSPRGRRARPPPPTGKFPARSPNNQSRLSIWALTSGSAKRAGSLPEATSVGALSAQMRGRSPRSAMSGSRRHRPSAARKERSFRVAANGSNGPKPPLGSEREASPMANTMDRQFGLGAYRRWSDGRDRKRQPSVPARRPVAGVEFSVGFQVHIALHACDRKKIADLRTNPDDTRFEWPELCAGSAVSRELVIDIADRAYLKAR
jgi:hypothetical protein